MNPDDYNLPTMEQDELEKSDLPQEIRNFNFSLVVEFNLDARGRPSNPKILTSSGNPTVDQITVQEIMRYNFMPATRKDNGQPVAILMFWNFRSSGNKQ